MTSKTSERKYIEDLKAARGDELRNLTKAELIHAFCAAAVRAELALVEQRTAIAAELRKLERVALSRGDSAAEDGAVSRAERCSYDPHQAPVVCAWFSRLPHACPWSDELFQMRDMREGISMSTTEQAALIVLLCEASFVCWELRQHRRALHAIIRHLARSRND